MELRPKPLAMKPMTLPRWSGNQVTGRVMVTMMMMAREEQLTIPYTQVSTHTRTLGRRGVTNYHLSMSSDVD